MEKPKFIVIRDYCNQGKTTTIWLLLKALVEDNAQVKKLFDLNHNCDIEIPSEMPPKGKLENIDCLAVLEWHDLIIVLNSRGDYVHKPVQDIRYAMQNWSPDYIICAIQNKEENSYRGNNIWNNFKWYFPATQYERICFWTEYAEEEKDAIRVKQPTVEAIMKYMA